MYFNLKFCITNNNTGLFVEKALLEREKFQYLLICVFFSKPQQNTKTSAESFHLDVQPFKYMK